MQLASAAPRVSWKWATAVTSQRSGSGTGRQQRPYAIRLDADGCGTLLGTLTWVMGALEHGMSPAEVEARLVDQAEGRQRKDAVRYAARTVRAALKKVGARA